MNIDEIQQVKKAIRYWADNHPNPDGIALQSASGYEYTPKEIADEVDKETEFGKLQLRVIEHALKEHSLDEIVKGFYSIHKTFLQ